MSKIRILNVITSFEMGGTESFLMNYLRAIDRSKFELEYIVLNSTSSPYRHEIEQLGAKIHFVNLDCSILNTFRFIRGFKKFLIKNGPYDVIHSHINLSNGIVLLVAKLVNIPKRISHSHSIDSSRGNILKRLKKKIERLLIKYNSTDKWACGIDAGISLYGQNSDFKIINNGIDVKRFTNINKNDIENLRIEFNLQESSHVFVNISRFDENKNILFVIDIFKEFLKYRSDSVLIIGGGDGSYKETCINRVKKYGIIDKVRFTGPRNDISAILGLCDAYIMPSFNEGFGIIALEVQASGTPIFMSDKCPKEADMDLGLAHFISLDNTSGYWATQILQFSNTIPKSTEAAFIRKGFEIGQNARVLEKYYED